MAFARDERTRLAKVLKWARETGWKRGPWPYSWQTSAYTVSYYSGKIDVLKAPSPLNPWITLTPGSVDEVLNVLGALDILPPDLTPMVIDLLVEPIAPVVDIDALDTYDPPADPIRADKLDGPSRFTDAGQTFADLVDGRVSAGRAAEVLSTLAGHGLIVSTEYHDETTAELAAHTGAELCDVAMIMPSGALVPMDGGRWTTDD